VEPAADRAPPYRDKVEVHFPGAQAAVVATECKVHFTGSDNDETVELKEEVAIDITTGAILADNGSASRRLGGKSPMDDTGLLVQQVLRAACGFAVSRR